MTITEETFGNYFTELKQELAGIESTLSNDPVLLLQRFWDYKKSIGTHWEQFVWVKNLSSETKENRRKMFRPVDEMYNEHLQRVTAAAIQFIHQHPSDDNTKILRDYFFSMLDYKNMAVLGDGESFNIIFEKASKNVNEGYDDAVAALFYALADFARLQPYRDTVITFFKKNLKKIGAPGKKEPDYNTPLIVAISYCIARLNIREFTPLIYELFVFASQTERSYEMHLAAGDLALILVALNYDGDLSSFHAFLNEYESVYTGNDFIMKVKYALWLLTADKSGSLEYLKDDRNKSGNAYAACAAADLNLQDALAVLQEQISSIDNPVTREVFEEAISRLTSQETAPPVENRMIHLFGVVTNTEMALGEESDNIFIMRASHKTEKVSGIRYEVDDSPAPDRI